MHESQLLQKERLAFERSLSQVDDDDEKVKAGEFAVITRASSGESDQKTRESESFWTRQLSLMNEQLVDLRRKSNAMKTALEVTEKYMGDQIEHMKRKLEVECQTKCCMVTF